MLEDIEFSASESVPGPELTLSLQPKLVHPRTGIIHSVQQVPVDEDYGLSFVSAIGSRWILGHVGGAPSSAADSLGSIGAGISQDPDIATVKAIGEAVQRYCVASLAGPAIVGSLDELGDRALDPRALAPVSDRERERYPGLRAFSPSTRTRWRGATRVLGGGTVLVPETFVVSTRTPLNELRMTSLLPNSFACANGPTEAAARALAEAIERDALMTFWLRRRPAPRLDLEALRADPHIDALCAALDALRVEVLLLDLQNDVGRPVIACFLVARDAPPACVLGLGSGAHGARAAQKAIEEAIHMRARFRMLARNAGGDGGALSIPAAMWWNDASLKRAWFLGTDGVSIPTRGVELSPLERLRDLAARIEGVGARAYVCDVTPPDIRPFPLRTCVAVVPGLVPESLVVGHYHEATPRLADAPLGEEALPLPCP